MTKNKGIVDFLFSIEFISHLPFVRSMPLHRVSIGSRLELTIFYGINGSPKRFTLVKRNGRADRIRANDRISGINFPMPESSFKALLTHTNGQTKQRMGRYTWMWLEEGDVLCAFDDMDFYLTRSEASMLEKIIFETKVALLRSI